MYGCHPDRDTIWDPYVFGYAYLVPRVLTIGMLGLLTVLPFFP